MTTKMLQWNGFKTQPFKYQPTKWSNTLKQFVSFCSSVFNYFISLVLTKGLSRLTHIKVPRCLVPSVKWGSFSINVFTDVSERYCAICKMCSNQWRNKFQRSNVKISCCSPKVNKDIKNGVVWCSPWTEFRKINEKCPKGGHERSHLKGRQCKCFALDL